jgi:uncharacterized integral membrane protein
MSSIKTIVIILFCILIAAFAVTNQHSVEVHFYDLQLHTHSFSVPVIGLVLCPLFLGFLMGWFQALWGRVKMKRVLSRQSKTLDTMQRDLEKLRPAASTTVEPSGVGSD